MLPCRRIPAFVALTLLVGCSHCDDETPTQPLSTPPICAFSFSLQVSPSGVTVALGSSEVVTVTATATGGSAFVDLSVFSAPTGTTQTFGGTALDLTTSASASTTLTISNGTTAVAGDFTVGVRGTPRPSECQAVVEDASVVLTIPAAGRWRLVSSGVATAMNDVHFPSASVGYIGHGGGVLKTSDGGVTWNSRLTNKVVNAVYFTSETTGYAATNEGELWRTTDGGQGWSNLGQITPTFGLPLYDVQFLDANRAFVGGQLTGSGGGGLWYTADAGANWTEVTGLYNDFWPYVFSLHFSSETTGVVGAANTAYTADGGDTWTESEVTNVWDMSFADAQNGVAVTGISGSGAVIRTTDGGATWSDLPSPAQRPGFFGVSNLGSMITVGGNGGEIHRSDDNGATWTMENELFGVTVWSLFMFSDTQGIAVGTTGEILRRIQ